MNSLVTCTRIRAILFNIFTHGSAGVEKVSTQYKDKGLKPQDAIIQQKQFWNFSFQLPTHLMDYRIFLFQSASKQEVQGHWHSAWSLARQEKVRFKCLPDMKLVGKYIASVATRIMLSTFWNALNYLRLTLNSPWDSPFKVTKVKCNHTIGVSIYDFLLRFTSNFMTYKPSKCQWSWLWPYKVTRDQMWWCCWTLHMLFPIGV